VSDGRCGLTRERSKGSLSDECDKHDNQDKQIIMISVIINQYLLSRSFLAAKWFRMWKMFLCRCKSLGICYVR
jgi:hypothetical protein